MAVSPAQRGALGQTRQRGAAVELRCELVIDLPRARVIELFDDPDSMRKWQPTLKSFEPLSGTPGQPGAKSRLVYEERGRTIEMIETVTSRNLPDEFSGTYATRGLMNWITNRFVEEGPTKTRWISETRFEFSGLMRIMAALTRGAIRKQTLQFMHNFKQFAERA
jgi:hypothetical protein